jgi:serine/threonine protein kinase
VKSTKTEEAELPAQIGRYRVLKSIGRGGMGEVYLCWDPHLDRQVALKRIRPHLIDQPRIRHRFLREARIAGQLSHPSIIPVFELHDKEEPFYVMPHLTGQTLRAVLQQGLEGAPPIPSLLRVFLQICQAVAYAHSRGILHRDLKPENIIVGDFGEVVLLDWGLAKTAEEIEIEAETPDVDPHVTSVGKIVGTLAYMAPERTLRQPATVLTEIYALGVILYQILCLRLPFRRKSFKEFRKTVHRERFEDPAKLAPLREVPAQLVRIVKRCLHPIPTRRYSSVEALIADIETVLEGRSDWFPVAELNIHHKSDWEFQEHVWLAPMAGLSSFEPSEWVGLMISKGSFSGNVRLETLIRLKPGSQGIGFLLSVPEASERLYPDDGYLIWLGSEKKPGLHLFRRHASVMEKEDFSVPYDRWLRLVVEKVDNAIRCTLDDQLILSYLSHLPLHGTHLGVLHRDADFDLSPIKVATGNSSAVQSCLALPDAFLSHGEYARALAEYRRIAYSFPERSEGREALFRAGLTLVEKARQASHPAQKEALQSQARSEFERLHNTPSAPLEYLGKSLLAHSQGLDEEEVQYLELGLRRYPGHPLAQLLEEQVSHRLSEVARSSRTATARFLGLILRLLPQWASRSQTQALVRAIATSLPLPFPGSPNPTVSVETALCQAERVAASLPLPEAVVSLVALHRVDLLFGATEVDSWSARCSALVVSPLAPSAEAWREAAASQEPVALACLWLTLLRRSQDQAWDITALINEVDRGVWTTEDRVAVLQQETWLALQLCHLDLARERLDELSAWPPSLATILLRVAMLFRQSQADEADRVLRQEATAQVAERSPSTDPALLAWRSLTATLPESLWSRALPLEQRESLRWVRLMALCRGQHEIVDAIQRALESKLWGMPPTGGPQSARI